MADTDTTNKPVPDGWTSPDRAAMKARVRKLQQLMAVFLKAGKTLRLYSEDHRFFSRFADEFETRLEEQHAIDDALTFEITPTSILWDGNTVFEERWSPPAGDTLIGTGRSFGEGKTTFFEHLLIRVHAEQCLEYVAWPGGRPRTTFVLVQHDNTNLVFSNLDNDWPSRIHYHQVQPGQLRVTLSNDNPNKTQVVELKRKPGASEGQAGGPGR